MSNHKKDEFKLSIDGKDWTYRSPRNHSMIQRYGHRNKGNKIIGGNPHAYDMTNPLYDYSYGTVRDAAQAKGINNVNSQKEVDTILSHIQNPVAESTNESQEKKKDKKTNKNVTSASPVYESETMRLAKERSARYDAGMTPSPFASNNSSALDSAITNTINNSSVTPASNVAAQGFMKDFKDKFSFKPVFNS